MNKYLQSLILLFVLFLVELVPFLYNEDYSYKEMKWGWIIMVPILLLIRNTQLEERAKKAQD